jgi:Bacterial PH domain
MTHYFPTRKSLGLGMFLWASMLVPLAYICYDLFQGYNLTGMLIVALVFIPSIILLYAVWFRTGYFLNEESLIVKIGPYTERDIEISKIISVKRSFSLIASPANSFRRLKIHYRSGEILISPVREGEFLGLLSRLNERIRIEV